MTHSAQRSARRRSTTRRSRTRGATTVEYALLVALVVAVALGAWQFLGQRIKCALGFASAQISADGYAHGACSNGGPGAAAATGQPSGIAAP